MFGKIIVGLSMFLVLTLGIQMEVFAAGKKKQARFKVVIENISDPEGLITEGDAKYPFAVSPGLFVVSNKKKDLFRAGTKADAGLEAQAEDGNPEILLKSLLSKAGSRRIEIFNKPVGAQSPAPILPGGSYELTFTATEGMKLNFIAMFGQSNDLFYAPEEAFDLFVKGQPISGDITDKLMLWDAGTEVNQAPGVGDQQAPRQKSANTGMAERGVVKLVKDGFSYPETKNVLRITIVAE